MVIGDVLKTAFKVFHIIFFLFVSCLVIVALASSGSIWIWLFGILILITGFPFLYSKLETKLALNSRKVLYARIITFPILFVTFFCIYGVQKTDQNQSTKLAKKEKERDLSEERKMAEQLKRELALEQAQKVVNVFLEYPNHRFDCHPEINNVGRLYIDPAYFSALNFKVKETLGSSAMYVCGGNLVEFWDLRTNKIIAQYTDYKGFEFKD